MIYIVDNQDATLFIESSLDKETFQKVLDYLEDGGVLIGTTRDITWEDPTWKTKSIEDMLDLDSFFSRTLRETDYKLICEDGSTEYRDPTGLFDILPEDFIRNWMKSHIEFGTKDGWNNLYLEQVVVFTNRRLHEITQEMTRPDWLQSDGPDSVGNNQ